LHRNRDLPSIVPLAWQSIPSAWREHPGLLFVTNAALGPWWIHGPDGACALLDGQSKASSVPSDHGNVFIGDNMNKLNVIGICFAAGYLSICLISSNFQPPGIWDIFWWAAFAIPFSFLSLFVIYYIGGSPILFLAMNAIWWFFLPRLFYYSIRFVVRKLKNLKNHSS